MSLDFDAVRGSLCDGARGGAGQDGTPRAISFCSASLAPTDYRQAFIGNHFPEFHDKADLSNLKDALQRLDVPYPAAQDNGRPNV